VRGQVDAGGEFEPSFVVGILGAGARTWTLDLRCGSRVGGIGI